MIKILAYASILTVLLSAVALGYTEIGGCATLGSAGEYYKLTAGVTNNVNTCINITANDIILDCGGNAVDGTLLTDRAGINATGVDNITIVNCTLNEFHSGIFLDGVTGATIWNNTADRNTRAVYGHNSLGINITNNTLHDSRFFEVLLQNVNQSAVCGNDLRSSNELGATDERAGIQIERSEWNEVVGNTIRRNSTVFNDYTYGIHLKAEDGYVNNTLIEGNDISVLGETVHGIGINTSNLAYEIVTDVQVIDNLVVINRSVAGQNTWSSGIKINTFAVGKQYTKRILIANNRIFVYESGTNRNVFGIYDYHSYFNKYMNNSIYLRTGYDGSGIHLYDEVYNAVLKNISIDYASTNTQTFISKYGIRLVGSGANNTFEDIRMNVSADAAAYGFGLNNAERSNISDCRINVTGDNQAQGISSLDGDDLTLADTYILVSGTSGIIGLRLNGDGARVNGTRVHATGVDSSSSGVIIQGESDDNLFWDNEITGGWNGLLLWGVTSTSPDNNIIWDTTIDGAYSDINFSDYAGSGNILLNCTYDNERVANGQLIRKWHFWVNVTSAVDHTPIAAATVQLERNTGELTNTGNTAADGLISFNATQYVNLSGVTTWWNYYTANGSKAGYDTTSRQTGLASNIFLDLPLSPLGAPRVEWNWTDINSTTYINTTIVGINSTELVNCTLHFNGTDYVNGSVGKSITWAIEASDGNWSSVNVSCEDVAGNGVDTTNAWWAVDTSPIIRVAQCFNLDYPNRHYIVTADINDHKYSCFNVTADNVSLDCQGHLVDGLIGFLARYGTAVNATAGNSNITITNCTVEDFEWGMLFRDAGHVVVNKSKISDNPIGIGINSTNVVSVFDNNISECDEAIKINLSTQARIFGNNLTDDGIGVAASLSTHISIYQNQIFESSGIYFKSTNSSTVSDNNITGNPVSSGIYLLNSENARILRNIIEIGSTGDSRGIFHASVVDVEDTVISNNTINISQADDGYGIHVMMNSFEDDNATNFTIGNNTVHVSHTENRALGILIGLPTRPPLSFDSGDYQNFTVIGNYVRINGTTWNPPTFFTGPIAGIWIKGNTDDSTHNNFSNNQIEVYGNDETAHGLYSLGMDSSVFTDNRVKVVTESGRGISIDGGSNTVIDNRANITCNESIGTSYDVFALHLSGDFMNVTQCSGNATGGGDYKVGIYLSGDNSYMWNNWAYGDVSGLYGAGICKGNHLWNNTFSGGRNGYENFNCEDNIFQDSIFEGGYYDINFTGGAGDDEIFLNCTYDNEMLTGGRLIRQWYIWINVTNSTDGGAIPGVNVTLKQTDGSLTHWNLTGTDGFTPRMNVTQYVNNSAFGITWWTNYTVNGSKLDYFDASRPMNFTNNKVFNLTMEESGGLKIRWDWADINSTTNDNTTTVGVLANRLVNCTLHFNGTDYANSSVGANITWFVEASTGNHSDINVTCDDLHGSTNETTNAWWSIDMTLPLVEWNWTDINSSTSYNTSVIGINASEAVNCTLHFNGTDYVNGSVGKSITWFVEVAEGNWSSVNISCEDVANNPAQTTNAWWLVDMRAPRVIWGDWTGINSTTAFAGTTVNWTTDEFVIGCNLSINGTVYTNNTLGMSFSIRVDGLANGNYSLYVNCSDGANIGNSTKAWWDVQAPDDGPFCGDGICGPGEGCGNCPEDCGECDEDQKIKGFVIPMKAPIIEPPEKIQRFGLELLRVVDENGEKVLYEENYQLEDFVMKEGEIRRMVVTLQNNGNEDLHDVVLIVDAKDCLELMEVQPNNIAVLEPFEYTDFKVTVRGKIECRTSIGLRFESNEFFDEEPIRSEVVRREVVSIPVSEPAEPEATDLTPFAILVVLLLIVFALVALWKYRGRRKKSLYHRM